VSLTELTATSRVTVFPLESLTVAYTTQSSDERGLGDIGLVSVVDERSDGDELWRLARDLGGRTNDGDQADGSSPRQAAPAWSRRTRTCPTRHGRRTSADASNSTRSSRTTTS